MRTLNHLANNHQNHLLNTRIFKQWLVICGRVPVIFYLRMCASVWRILTQNWAKRRARKSWNRTKELGAGVGATCIRNGAVAVQWLGVHFFNRCSRKWDSFSFGDWWHPVAIYVQRFIRKREFFSTDRVRSKLTKDTLYKGIYFHDRTISAYC